jgi:hypothetical protein
VIHQGLIREGLLLLQSAIHDDRNVCVHRVILPS